MIIDNESQCSLLLQHNVHVQNILNFGTAYISEKILPKIKCKFWIDVFLSHIQIYRNHFNSSSAGTSPYCFGVTKIKNFKLTELVSGSTRLSMKNILYFSFDVFAATSNLCFP